ncbi:hypothetical protein Hanom_Chr09g00863041 [Helianthus anomalus]
MNLMMNLYYYFNKIYNIYIYFLTPPRFASRLTPFEAKGKRLETRFRFFKP